LAIVVLAALLALAGLGGGVWGLYSGSSSNAGDELVAASDLTAPTASSSVIGKTQGGVPGYIHQGGTYNVYANVADSGAPASGIASVTGDVSAITAALTATPLTAGAFTMGGTSYGYRSATLTTNAVLAAATYPYTLTSKDGATNTRTQSGFSVVVDNTVPTASDVQTTNKAGNNAGRPEIGDTIIFTFSEPIDPISVLASWTGASTSVVTRIDNNVFSPNFDGLTIYNAANSLPLALGTVNLGHKDYVSANATFGATGTASTMVMSGNTITVTLGTASSGTSTAGGNGTMVWSPSVNAFDRAANAQSATASTETGAADKDF